MQSLDLSSTTVHKKGFQLGAIRLTRWKRSFRFKFLSGNRAIFIGSQRSTWAEHFFPVMAKAWLFSIFRLRRSDDQNESHCQPPPSNCFHLPPHRNHCFLAREKLWDVIFTYSFGAIALEVRYRRKFFRFSTVFLVNRFFFFFIHPLSLCAFQPSLFLFVSVQEIVPFILPNYSD